MSKKEKHGFIKILKNNFFMLKYVFKYVPLYGVVHIILQMMFGLFDVMWGVVMIKVIVDAVTVQKSIEPVLIAVAIYAVYGFTIQVTAAYVYEIFEPIQLEKLNKAMNKDLYTKAAQLDYSCYSNPEFFNDFVWAASQCEGKAGEVLANFAALAKNFVTISGIGTVMFMLDKVGLLVVLIAVAASFISRLIQNKLQLKRAEESKPYERKRDYINRVFYLVDYAKELRLSHLKNKLKDEYSEANNSIKGFIKKYFKKFIVIEFFAYYVFSELLIESVYLLSLAYRTIVVGSITPGTFASMTDGVWTIRWSLNNFITSLTAFQEKSLYIEKFRKFLAYENKIVDMPDALPMPDSVGALSIKDVSFTYDGCDEPTLKNISLDIKAKEKIAIVGYNGAGKSTLIKLLTRLYDVTDGSITYNGKDIRDYKVAEYYKSFGIVFQDHQLYAGSLFENVIMDASQGENDIRRDTAITALEKSSFKVKLQSLKDGLDSEMTREFHDDGISLSGGETQKVAVSRIFANRNARILILDEPSSALDPMSEFNLNRSMLEASEDKTVIFISHRLSTTKIADKIYMMENGEIVESGSHDELMTLNGKYAEMFNVQTKSYAAKEMLA